MCLLQDIKSTTDYKIFVFYDLHINKCNTFGKVSYFMLIMFKIPSHEENLHLKNIFLKIS